MLGSCCGSVVNVRVVSSFDKSLWLVLRRAASQKLYCCWRRECSFILDTMEGNAGASHANKKQHLESSVSAKGGNKPAEKEISTPAFVNHAAIAWDESRRKWIGDQTKRRERMTRDPIISWSTTYEELLSTNEPFSERISLTEMVDFLVDIWHNEGLFD